MRLGKCEKRNVYEIVPEGRITLFEINVIQGQFLKNMVEEGPANIQVLFKSLKSIYMFKIQLSKETRVLKGFGDSLLKFFSNERLRMDRARCVGKK